MKSYPTNDKRVVSLDLRELMDSCSDQPQPVKEVRAEVGQLLVMFNTWLFDDKGDPICAPYWEFTVNSKTGNYFVFGKDEVQNELMHVLRLPGLFLNVVGGIRFAEPITVDLLLTEKHSGRKGKLKIVIAPQS